MSEEHGIGTYPVGLLSDIKHHRLKPSWSYLVSQAKNGNWRAVHNHFNGYLAEWHYPPPGALQHYCGHGWTRKRALRRLGRSLVESNLSVQERNR